MKQMMTAVAVAMITLAGAAGAQAPASAPAGSTGICKDGSYWSGPTKSGACRGHKGIQTWYADAASPAKPAAAAAPAAANAAKPTPVMPAVKSAPAAPAPAVKAASGPAPAGSTGLCKDGSYWTGPTKSGACRGHQGIQTWYADAAGAAPLKPAAMPAPAPAAAVPSRPAPAPAPMAAPAMPAPAPAAATAAGASARQGPAAAAAAKPLAPGGGPGLVWVNTDSNVYHCNGSVYYGKTKAGQYMSEAAAQAKGAHGDRGKTCAGK